MAQGRQDGSGRIAVIPSTDTQLGTKGRDRRNRREVRGRSQERGWIGHPPAQKVERSAFLSELPEGKRNKTGRTPWFSPCPKTCGEFAVAHRVPDCGSRLQTGSGPVLPGSALSETSFREFHRDPRFTTGPHGHFLRGRQGPAVTNDLRLQGVGELLAGFQSR